MFYARLVSFPDAHGISVISLPLSLSLSVKRSLVLYLFFIQSYIRLWRWCEAIFWDRKFIRFDKFFLYIYKILDNSKNKNQEIKIVKQLESFLLTSIWFRCFFCQQKRGSEQSGEVCQNRPEYLQEVEKIMKMLRNWKELGCCMILWQEEKNWTMRVRYSVCKRDFIGKRTLYTGGFGGSG